MCSIRNGQRFSTVFWIPDGGVRSCIVPVLFGAVREIKRRKKFAEIQKRMVKREIPFE